MSVHSREGVRRMTVKEYPSCSPNPCSSCPQRRWPRCPALADARGHGRKHHHGYNHRYYSGYYVSPYYGGRYYRSRYYGSRYVDPYYSGYYAAPYYSTRTYRSRYYSMPYSYGGYYRRYR